MLQLFEKFHSLKYLVVFLAGLLIFQTANAAGVILLNATAYSYDYEIPDSFGYDYTIRYMDRDFTPPEGIYVDNNSNSTWRYFILQMVQNSTISISGYNWIYNNSPDMSIVMPGYGSLILKILNSKVSELTQQPFIRWLGVLPPEFKMDNTLLNLLYTEPNQTVNVSAWFFDAPDEEQLSVLRKYAVRPIENISSDGDVFYFAVKVNDTREIAKLENIQEVYRDMHREIPLLSAGNTTDLGIFGQAALYEYAGNYPGYNYILSSEKAAENNSPSANTTPNINDTAPSGGEQGQKTTNTDSSGWLYLLVTVAIILIAALFVVVRGVV